MTKEDMYEMLHNIQRNYVAKFDWEAQTELPHYKEHNGTYAIDVRIYDKFSISLLDLQRLTTAADITWETSRFKGKWVCITIHKSGNDIVIYII